MRSRLVVRCTPLVGSKLPARVCGLNCSPMHPGWLYAGWPGGLFILMVVYMVLRFSTYPELIDFHGQEYSLEIYDRNGILLKVTSLEEGMRRIYRNLKDIPDVVKRVFIAAEDSRFYFHPGVDPASVVRAFYQNRSEGSIVSGASTISMQLAGIVSGPDHGYIGKIKEIINALRIESRLSKHQILELWLNNIPFSFQVEGVAAASLKFLGRQLSSMDTEASVLLAIIPRSPSVLSPLRNKNAAIAAAARLGFNSGLLGIRNNNNTDDIAESLRKVLDQSVIFQWPDITPHFSLFTEGQIKSGKAEILIPGSINTTVDSYLNGILEDRINYYLSLSADSRITNGAGLIIDNVSGGILAYVGSADFKDEKNSGQIDGVRILNQPGSTLKPFLYALAIEEGFRPNSVLPDIPQQLGGPEAYLPMNFDRSFHGPVLLRIALASSMNVPAVYMINRLGVLNFADFLINLGFESIGEQREYVGTGLALGNAEVSLMELTGAFSIFPRGGNSLPLTPFPEKMFSESEIKIDDPEMRPYTAGIIRDILTDNNSRFPGFGADSIMNTEFEAMFKTGTSNQFQNIWALGATPEYTVGIWMGDFSGNTVIGRTGSSLPAAIAAEMLELIHVTGSKFDQVPDSMPIRLCPLSGLRPNEYTPSTYIEFLPAGEVPEISDWHVIDPGNGSENKTVITIYPEEYNSWLAVKDRTGTISVGKGIPEIVYPADNSVFFIDPAVPLSDQILKIEGKGFSMEDSLVYINGINAGFLDNGSYYFELRKGEWKIEFRGTEEKDMIRIFVR